MDNTFRKEASVVEVPPDSNLLAAVMRLWRKNSATLGFFPEGAFNAYAANGHILGAVCDGECIGYLLYATSRHYARITHLCVKEDFRGQEIPELLFGEVERRAEQLESVRLTCRRDFEFARRLWRRLGLSVVGEKPARAEGKVLEIWKRELAGLPLLNYLDEVSEREKHRVVIDANIFIALAKKRTSECDEREWMDAKALEEEWLSELVELHITPEIYAEVSRQNSTAIRQRRRSALQRFPVCEGNGGLFETAEKEIRQLYPENLGRRDESDIRHVAHSVAGDADYFVTNDAGILNRRNEVSNLFELEIVTPAELVTNIHEAEHRNFYRPARLEGTTTRVRRVTAADIEELQKCFLDYGKGENGSGFRRKLDAILLSPDEYNVRLISDKSDPLALWVERRAGKHLNVPILRVRRGKLKTTLAVHLVWVLTRTAGANDMRVITVSDEFLDPELIQALSRYDFHDNDGDCWKRTVMRGIYSPTELAQQAAEQPAATHNNVELLLNEKTPEGTAKVERTLWPAKVTNSALPSFIVPIKPTWAMQLFDKRLAEGDLFGAEPEVMLNGENVYYRSAHQKILSAPARVLWYVSNDPTRPGTKAIRASSQVIEIRRGSASKLFKQFEHLGVYRWEDIRSVANGDSDGKVTAFRFTLTELFENPVPWHDFQSILQDTRGKTHPLQSPAKVPESAFLRIYRKGTGVP